MTPRYDAAGDDVTPRYDALSPRSEVLARTCIHTHTHTHTTHAHSHTYTQHTGLGTGSEPRRQAGVLRLQRQDRHCVGRGDWGTAAGAEGPHWSGGASSAACLPCFLMFLAYDVNLVFVDNCVRVFFVWVFCLFFFLCLNCCNKTLASAGIGTMVLL